MTQQLCCTLWVSVMISHSVFSLPAFFFLCVNLLRWDIQRIREQRMFQRLQQRMNRKKIVPETEPELSSFYPDTEDGTSA